MTEAWIGTLLQYAPHSGLQRWVRDLNTFYRGTPELYEQEYEPRGFAWVDCSDNQQSVISFLRRANADGGFLLCVCNFTPVPRMNYRVGAPLGGYWKEVLNSDAPLYGGSGQRQSRRSRGQSSVGAWAAFFVESLPSAVGYCGS